MLLSVYMYFFQKVPVPLRFTTETPLYIPLFLRTCYVPRPSHLDLNTIKPRREKYKPCTTALRNSTSLLILRRYDRTFPQNVRAAMRLNYRVYHIHVWDV
jgi:hypothetical protein